jgi:hypothetical protein
MLFQALKKLQRNKAAGLDGMKIEFILDVRELLHVPLSTTFNCFLVEGFLEGWHATQKPFPLGWSIRSLKGVMPPNLTTTWG